MPLIIDRDCWKRGAIYRTALARRLDRSTIVALLESRGNLTHAAAAQLAGHWLSSGPFRSAARQDASLKRKAP